MKILKFTKGGVIFEHKNEEVVYLYPWIRTESWHKFLNIRFNLIFGSLKDMYSYVSARDTASKNIVNSIEIKSSMVVSNNEVENKKFAKWDIV